MKRILKKGLVLTIIMCIFVGMQSSAIYAATIQEKTNDKASEWYTDEELLERLGLIGAEPINTPQAKSLVADNKPVYINERGTKITIIENTSERVELKFQNGDKVNSIAFTDDGRTYMCGKDVTTFDENGKPEKAKLFDIQPKAGFSTYYSNKCPYGSASDYTHKYGTEQNANMALSDRLGDLIVETFISFLCGKFVVGGPVAEELFKAVYYELKKTNPQTTALSYKATLWSHKNYSSGYVPSLFTFVWKYKVTLYPKANFGDAANAEVRNNYKCKMTV